MSAHPQGYNIKQAPPPSLSFLFLCSEDTRKTCFYCHLINKFWGLNYIGISTGRGPPSGWWNPGTGWQFLNKRSLPPPPFFSEFPWGLKWVNKTFKLKKSIHSINLEKCNEMARVHIDFRGKVTFSKTWPRGFPSRSCARKNIVEVRLLRH